MTREQKILRADDNYRMLDEYFAENGTKSIFLVCGNSIAKMAIDEYFKTLEDRLGIKVTRFSDFSPNPDYESAKAGVEAFLTCKTDDIVAVGGGSALDVAKCIKFFSNMDHGKDYLSQSIVSNGIRLLAMPTTAGTGSEATHFAVIYYNGEKKSIAHPSGVPNAVLFDPKVLMTLPENQKKATMLDALCHAVESMWCVKANDESREFSGKAIRMILENYEGYIRGDENGARKMLEAAHIAGKAINITQTTAGHAMCYKITSLFKTPHGHAAAMCVDKLWPYMVEAAERAPVQNAALNEAFARLARAFECKDPNEAGKRFSEIVASLKLEKPKATEEDIHVLASSVNTERLGNNPVILDIETIRNLYMQIFEM